MENVQNAHFALRANFQMRILRIWDIRSGVLTGPLRGPEAPFFAFGEKIAHF